LARPKNTPIFSPGCSGKASTTPPRVKSRELQRAIAAQHAAIAAQGGGLHLRQRIAEVDAARA
jgi:hypothetical protein